MSAEQAWTAYEEKEAAVNAARGRIDPAGELVRRLEQEADAAYAEYQGELARQLDQETDPAYAEYQAAWFRQNYPGGALEVRPADEPEIEATS